MIRSLAGFSGSCNKFSSCSLPEGEDEKDRQQERQDKKVI